MTRLVAAGLALSLAGLGLWACGGEETQQAQMAPQAIPGVTAANGRLVLPAVKGNPGALYFDLAYGEPGTRARVALSRVEIAGAKRAILHDYSDMGGRKVMGEIVPPVIAKGETLRFEPGGKHVMAMELDDSLVAGGTTEVTLTFAGGDKLSFPAEIRAAGDDR